MFQQDGAPAHAPLTSRDFLEREMAFYWVPNLSPPFSPHLNAQDSEIGSVFDTKV